MAGEVMNANLRTIGSVVRPQKVTVDPSVVKHVVDFFNDILPQTLQGTVPHRTNDKEVVLWLKVEQPERLGDVPDAFSPVYLTLGYSNGVQIWAIEPHGEAWEVYSSRQGPIRTLRILPLPEEVYGSGDLFAEKRPLIAMCDAASGASLHQNSNISIISLYTGEKVHNIKFRSAVEEIYCNQRVIVVAFPDRFVVIDSCTMKERFYVNASFPVHLVSPNPISVGKRWIAYSEGKVHDMYHSLGGRIIDGVPSYTASVISAAKTISQGITNIGEVVASSIAGTKKSPSSNFVTSTPEGKQEGVVTVVDIDNVGDNEISLEKSAVNRIGVVAHFLAHSSSAVAALAFNVDGTLLLTASQTGQNFHIFRISPHPAGSSMANVDHLYTLHRGDTNATVQDVTFSMDSRWVAVTSLRATTHVFPITPYGGPITYRTHSTSRVVNKASRFIKSAGLDELEVGGRDAGMSAPVTSGNSSPRYSDPNRAGTTVHVHAPLVVGNNNGSSSATSGPRGTPSRGPPVIVQPLSQIKHSGPSKSTHFSTSSLPSSKTPSSGGTDVVRVAACFAARRSRTTNESQVCDSLLIATSHGALVEYILQPVVGVEAERISDDLPVGLNVHAQAQWLLNRHLSHSEFQPPFSDTHPLVGSVAFAAKRKPIDESGGGGYTAKQPHRSTRQEELLNTKSDNEAWLSQVEIMTHSGPARRLWMGPQFRFAPTSTPGCAAGVILNSLPQTEIQRTGSDWDLTTGTNLKFSNFRIHSAPVSMPGISGSNQSLTIDAGSGSFDRAYFPDYITRDSSSNEDLRLTELADAMVDVHGRDVTDSHFRSRGQTDFDESPEDLSISSADSTGSGSQHARLLLSTGGILSQQTGTTFPVDFDGSSLSSGGSGGPAQMDTQTL
ncbi:Breast carcinoma-amplified sequence 3 [Hypsibius exemplaris]|uniref:Breast carcinoma-amplified sequence 3 n=1 Tax=Hypsibius exemplaris TaxID=2072580 RepID=A0A1W0X4N4_HYPEX|nr:Breast carcinoma-amplified sequence 3 [Hypsibius exemplaris]